MLISWKTLRSVLKSLVKGRMQNCTVMLAYTGFFFIFNMKPNSVILNNIKIILFSAKILSPY